MGGVADEAPLPVRVLMAERRVWVAQLLCGDNRHMIAGLAGECDDEQDADRVLGRPLWPQVERLGVNPWCAICGSPREKWRVELGRTVWKTMDEANKPLKQNASEQALANILLGTHGPKPPGRA